MGNNPPAHRRLVPRVPKKKDPSPEDLEVTSERVIHVDESSDELPRKLPRGSVDFHDESLPDESMEMTAVRATFAPPAAASEGHAASEGNLAGEEASAGAR